MSSNLSCSYMAMSSLIYIPGVFCDFFFMQFIPIWHIVRKKMKTMWAITGFWEPFYLIPSTKWRINIRWEFHNFEPCVKQSKIYVSSISLWIAASLTVFGREYVTPERQELLAAPLICSWYANAVMNYQHRSLSSKAFFH